MPFINNVFKLKMIECGVNGAMGQNKIKVEVVYALANEQKLIALDVLLGTTMYEAVVQSGILDVFPDIDVDVNKMGLFGKVVKNPKDYVMQEGDRVEIYRPLLIDPKQARLNRAAKKPNKQNAP